MFKPNLEKPCDDCPFRKEGGIRLSERRIDDIVEAERFDCHKTVHDDGWNDETGEYASRGDERMCAGWMIMREKLEDSEGVRIPQIMQIAERLGMYDKKKLMESADQVFDSVENMKDTAI
jgi:hypothetical protein